MSSSRGALAIFGAKAYFIVASYVLVFALTRILAPAEYGLWFVANGVVAFLGSVIVAATAQSMSRHIAHHPEREFDVRRTGLRVHALVGGVVSVALAALAVPIASLLREPELTPLLLLVSPIPFLYALYAAHIGIFNGRRQFARQAGFDTAFATLKTVLMVGAALAGLGAHGALAGFTLTAALILVPAARRSRGGVPGEPFPAGRFVGFSLVTIAFVALINLPLHLDALLVERGLGSEAVGVYGASLQVARIPYQLSVAISFVVFPFLASVESGGGARSDEARRCANRAFLYALVIGGIPAAVLTGSSTDIVPVLVGAKLGAAGEILRITGPALLVYTLVFLCGTMLVSVGRPGWAVLTACVTVVVQFALVTWWTATPQLAFAGGSTADQASLLGAGQGTLVAAGVGLVLGTVLLARAVGFRADWRIAAVLGVLAALVASSAAWRTTGIGAVVEAAVLGLAGLAIVLALRIIPWEDVRGLRKGGPARAAPESSRG